MGLDHGVDDLLVSSKAFNIPMDSMLVLDHSNKALEGFLEKHRSCTCDWAQWNSDRVIGGALIHTHITGVVLDQFVSRHVARLLKDLARWSNAWIAEPRIKRTTRFDYRR